MKMQEFVLHMIAYNLPELEILRCWVQSSDREAWQARIADFEPIPGLRYVEELDIDLTRYVLEKDGECPVGYRIL
jgi:hypothetical protein